MSLPCHLQATGAQMPLTAPTSSTGHLSFACALQQHRVMLLISSTCTVLDFARQKPSTLPHHLPLSHKRQHRRQNVDRRRQTRAGGETQAVDIQLGNPPPHTRLAMLLSAAMHNEQACTFCADFVAYTDMFFRRFVCQTDLDYFQIIISPQQRQQSGLRAIRNPSQSSTMQWDIDSAPQGVEIDGLIAKCTVYDYRYISCDQPIDGSCKLKLIRTSAWTAIGLATADNRKTQPDTNFWRWCLSDGSHSGSSGQRIDCDPQAAAGSIVELFYNSQVRSRAHHPIPFRQQSVRL